MSEPRDSKDALQQSADSTRRVVKNASARVDRASQRWPMPAGLIQGFLAVLISYLFLRSVSSSLPSCPDTSSSQYDYIVVGSGAGGGPVASRLAEEGYSVLVIEAGHNVDNVNTTLPAYLGRVLEDPETHLNYTLNEYPKDFPYQRDEHWYPRARGIGGCTIHNAVIDLMTGVRPDFNDLARTFNDSTLGFDHMWEYLKRIENNQYVPKILGGDHGYNGWLQTNTLPAYATLKPRFWDFQLNQILASMFGYGPTILDPNSKSAVDSEGVAPGSSTVTSNRTRSSVYQRLMTVQNSEKIKGSLSFSLDTLATKVALCQKGWWGSPRAYGVEIAVNATLPVADGFERCTTLVTRVVTARKEVIVAGGAFETPKLLMLSGLGDSKQLKRDGISTVVDLPGVGKNLRDHDEISVIFELEKNHALFEGCKFGNDSSDDPCLAYWESGHENLYSFGPNIVLMPYRTDPELETPDMIIYWLPVYFPDWEYGLGEMVAEWPNVISGVALRTAPTSSGTVTLTGSDPQDRVYIDKNHFQHKDARKDIVAMRDSIKKIRDVASKPLLKRNVKKELLPGDHVQSDQDLEKQVYNKIYGHHACCTAKMGSDDDKDAVLDGRFHVRGVKNLRVVDLSVWPSPPAFFPTTPMYMLAERAADMIVEDARKE